MIRLHLSFTCINVINSILSERGHVWYITIFKMTHEGGNLKEKNIAKVQQ